MFDCMWSVSNSEGVLMGEELLEGLKIIENHCAPPNISELFTHSEQVHSYSTRFSVAGSFYIKQASTITSCFLFTELVRKYGMASPSWIRKLRKVPFKRKLTHLLLKILETEEMNVDMRFIDLSSLHLHFNWPAISLTC